MELAERHQQRSSAAEPDDLSRDPRSATTVADHAHLADLDLEPGRFDDQADQVADAAATVREVGLLDRAGGARPPACSQLAFGCRPERRCDDLPRVLDLGVDRDIDLSGLGPQDHPAAIDPSVGLDVAVFDPAELALERFDRPTDHLKIGRVDEQKNPATIGDAAKGVARDVDYALRLNVECAGEHLL